MFNNEKLKECRKQAGYTQLDMAKLIGVARTAYTLTSCYLSIKMSATAQVSV